MIRIYVHIGPDGQSADRLQGVLHAKRDQLATKGVLYARSPGARNHTRLFMAVTDPDRVDSLRHARGYACPERQAALFSEVQTALLQEVTRHAPQCLILSAHQLGTAVTAPSEIARLHDLLKPLGGDIRIVAHLDDPARMLLRRYAAQLMEGRFRDIGLELDCLAAPSFWEAALATSPLPDPDNGQFGEVQGACFWLDYRRLVTEWEAVFGQGKVRLRSLDPANLYSELAVQEIRAAFDIDAALGKAEPAALPAQPSAAWLSRMRRFNTVAALYAARTGTAIPRPLLRRFLAEIKVHGDPVQAGALSAVSRRFEKDIAALCREHPGLDPALMKRDRKLADWQEADPSRGFRATQYLTAFRWRIQQAAKADAKAQAETGQRQPDAGQDTNRTTPGGKTAAQAIASPVPPMPSPAPAGALSPAAQRLMPPLAKQNFAKLQKSIFAPHNRLGQVNEEALAAAYTPVPPRVLPHGSSGNVIVACMKNEAPYILEWVAYHRTIGIDNFLIYSNDCEDGTTEILDRLAALGVIQHRNNDTWTGKSPQQHALDSALDEALVKTAEWLAHIDVDEFINIRCGNGTLSDFFERIPEATNVAMTWRLFGHNGVARLQDRLVIDQFDTCAPKYCPKPHTVWGFKTMFRNIGAYEKLSCHRPNKLAKGFESSVKWVNGSGADMTADAIKNGWRSSKKTIGYDLVQLNHYALRSAESFMIKRQRGRALHVDRAIGINYWIRMDWSVHRDITIKRNIPRLRAEYDRLLSDPALRLWHDKGQAWHRAKADELHGIPEFRDLYQQALGLKLTPTERVAFALALDMET
jgi:hypothetical protein